MTSDPEYASGTRSASKQAVKVCASDWDIHGSSCCQYLCGQRSGADFLGCMLVLSNKFGIYLDVRLHSVKSAGRDVLMHDLQGVDNIISCTWDM
eukprot:4189635-Amphidinium_carterae.2